MKQKILLILGLSFLLTGCVSQEEYDNALSQQNQLTSELDKSKKEIETLQGDLSKSKNELSSATTELSSLKEKLTLYRNETNPQNSSDKFNNTIEEEYINNFVSVYDFEAKYFDSLLDGKIPGVKFKIKNKGNKTLSRVNVTVYFKDADKKNIAEKEYYPILDSIASDEKELKPNYIFQMEPDRFYSAKTVPAEWKSGNAEIKVTRIEFKKD